MLVFAQRVTYVHICMSATVIIDDHVRDVRHKRIKRCTTISFVHQSYEVRTYMRMYLYVCICSTCMSNMSHNNSNFMVHMYNV